MDNDHKKKNLKALLAAVQRSKQEETGADSVPAKGGILEPTPGDLLGDFKIIREIGRGGMGVIYEAEQQSLNRRVALKVLYPSLSNSTRTLRRFHRESEAVGKLKHDNIIPVWAVGSDRGFHFFAMRFLPGPNLAELIEMLANAKKDGQRDLAIDLYGTSKSPVPSTAQDQINVPFPNEESLLKFSVDNYVYRAIELIANIAEGLEVAHKKGVVHRDVKPGNLVFSSTGQLVLTDFGIAKSLANPTITKTGEFIGSPGYISPEQAMAKRLDVDHRTDIYSLGVTLYEFLTLHQPFLHDTLEATLRAILTKTPESPRNYNPRLPKDIETVVLKAMEKDRDRRFSSAAEFATELRRILNFEAISSTPPGTFTKAARIIRQNRSTTVATAAVGAMIIGSLGMWNFMQSQSEKREENVKGITSLVSGVGGRSGDADLVAAVGSILEGNEQTEVEIDKRLSAITKALATSRFENAAQMLTQLDLSLRFALKQGDSWAKMHLPTIAENKIKLIQLIEQQVGDESSDPRNRTAVFAKARRLLSQSLLDLDPLVSKNASVSLGRIGDPLAVSSLFDAIYFMQEQGGERIALRSDFVEAIASIDHQLAFEALVKLSKHDDAAVCREAVRGLASQSHDGVLSQLEEVAENGNTVLLRQIAKRLRLRMVENEN